MPRLIKSCAYPDMAAPFLGHIAHFPGSFEPVEMRLEVFPGASGHRHIQVFDRSINGNAFILHVIKRRGHLLLVCSHTRDKSYFFSMTEGALVT